MMQTSVAAEPITSELRTLTNEKIRIENALWGLFISDALSMPAHWYYKREYIKRDFGAITGYNDAPHPHPESFMVGNGYHPDVSKANELGRPYDILHDHVRFYNASYNHLAIQTAERAGEHANAMPVLNERYHYHHGLKAGENTLAANLVRVLMRSVIAKGGYEKNTEKTTKQEEPGDGRRDPATGSTSAGPEAPGRDQGDATAENPKKPPEGSAWPQAPGEEHAHRERRTGREDENGQEERERDQRTNARPGDGKAHRADGGRGGGGGGGGGESKKHESGEGSARHGGTDERRRERTERGKEEGGKGGSQDAFLQDFIAYMSTPGNDRDPYCEIYIRAWFENYSKGVAPELCAQKQRTVWSIGSHGGVIRPLVLSIFANEPYQGLGMAISHQQLTHRSENVASALGVLVPLLHALLKGEDPHATISEYAKKVRLIKIKGEELSKTYRAHKGPGNIPKDQMWKIHTEFSNQYLDVNRVLEEYSDDEIIGKLFATACYPEHGVPLLLCLLQRNNAAFKASLLANANAGGDNVHRGMILGLLAGASNTEMPGELKSGLLAYNELKNEISDFVNLL